MKLNLEDKFYSIKLKAFNRVDPDYKCDICDSTKYVTFLDYKGEEHEIICPVCKGNTIREFDEWEVDIKDVAVKSIIQTSDFTAYSTRALSIWNGLGYWDKAEDCFSTLEAAEAECMKRNKELNKKPFKK